MVYFQDLSKLISLSKNYSVIRIPEYDLDGVITARIDMKVSNVDYIIESKVRNYY